MSKGKRTSRWKRGNRSTREWRIDVFRFGIVLFGVVIILRLFVLQVIDHDFYTALASGQHEIYKELIPSRGDILVHDMKDGGLLPVATNQQLAFVYADPRHIKDPQEAARKISEIFAYDEERAKELSERLDRKDDPYEPIQKDVPEEQLQAILALELKGISYIRQERRTYPEPSLGGHVFGFIGSDESGGSSGKYGIEGYFNDLLAGKAGFLRSERDIAGRLIAVGDRSIESAVDGSDIVLTIDRTIQFKACEAIKNAVARHGADEGSVVIMDPATGNVLAMCSAPDFDPNDFSNVESISVFNNPVTFHAYEPGSIFKPITMAAALDVGAITPLTLFEDTGAVKIDRFTIRNSDQKSHGLQTMTQVLEKSLNTGMIFAMRTAGQDKFVEYVKQFGFGKETAIELDTEMVGDIRSLDIGPEIYAATAAFGQGITATPLQMVTAYAAMANGGILKKPRIIDEIHHPDGSREKLPTQDVRRVIEPRTARQITTMLTAVVEQGHGGRASVPGYAIAGKTGTAQVPKKDGKGYEEDITIGSFAGFGPADNPRFAMVVRIDNPKDIKWAESTAAPVFGELANFLVKYLEIPPSRPVE